MSTAALENSQSVQSSWASCGRLAIDLSCPSCRIRVGSIERDRKCARLPCPACGFALKQVDGIWQSLLPERKRQFARFIAEYQTVRSREGRGSSQPEFYLALPDRDLTGRNVWQWKIRSRSFHFLERHVLPKVECSHGLDVLDIGAGNGWLSYRLALRGHRPVAVDLRTGREDGLGAAVHYFSHLPHPFLRFQAEMDRLPFAAGQFDLAIFNASFHYAEDYSRALQEALRCLRRPGHLLIMDSPFYEDERSGQRMLEERRKNFEKEFGFAGDSVASREFLSRQRLVEMNRECGTDWDILKPWYGAAWELRPLKAWFLRRREPSKFYIFWTAV
jgi:SAM-dependent methyltransferase